MQTAINIESWINKLQFSKATSGLRDGQIFAGKVTKFYPQQMAEVIVNGTKLMAKIEAPVEPHIRHLFQVIQSENGLVQLKIVPHAGNSTNENLPNQLLNIFHVKASKIGSTLAEMVTSNQMGVTKDSFLNALDWLNTVDNPSKGLSIVKLALMNQLPIHHTTLNALLSLRTGDSLMGMLESLAVHLKRDHGSVQYSHLVKELDVFLHTGKREMIHKVAQSLMDESAGILQKAGLSIKNGEMKSMDGIPNRLPEWIESVVKGNTSRPTELTSGEWMKVQQIISNIDLYGHFDKNSFLQRAFGSILQSLGIGVPIDRAEEQQSGTLKTILYQLMAESTPDYIKKQAEAILTRLAAFQLLSQETGPLQNVFMQLPIPFSAAKNDLTIQWTGRKQENGMIDPAYCRIVFYLELSHLKETVIDMNIQNRIITLKIWTEAAREATVAVNTLLPILKDNMEEKGYILSTVKIETHSERKPVESKVEESYYPRAGYTGVDYKI